jgi:hypothetical protein
MKKIVFQLVVFLVFIANYVFAQECEPYFPMMQGTETEITNYDSKGKKDSKIVHKVESKSTEGSKLLAKIHSETFDKKDKSTGVTDYTVECENGVFKFDMSVMISPEQTEAFQNMDFTVDGDFLEIPSNPSVGDELKDGHYKIAVMVGPMAMNMYLDVTNRKVFALEKVTTEAGEFDCAGIEYDSAAKFGIKVQAHVKEWYAKNVGLVKSETYNKKGKLIGSSKLTSYKK